MAQVGLPDEASASINELTTNFPGAAADPAYYMRGYMFLDELVEVVVDGLLKTGGKRINLLGLRLLSRLCGQRPTQASLISLMFFTASAMVRRVQARWTKRTLAQR